MVVFSKASDKVPHQRLLHKLDFYGVRDDTLRWIQSCLNYRKQQVLLEGSISAEADVLSGVPKGTVLGPFYSSHLLMTFQSLQILGFAPMTRCFTDKSRVIMMRDFSTRPKLLTSLQRPLEQLAFYGVTCTTKDVREATYRSIVRTTLEYASWDPYHSSDINHL